MTKRTEDGRWSGSPVSRDPHAVRVVIAHIDADGWAGLDPEALIELGLPAVFVDRFVEVTRVGDMSEVYVEVVGPDTRLRTVWSLDLLRGLVDHYGLDPLSRIRITRATPACCRRDCWSISTSTTRTPP